MCGPSPSRASIHIFEILQSASLQQEAANKSGAVSRVDIDVVDPMIFQDHSRNCYVDGLERPAVKVNAYLEANRNLHK